MLPSATEMQFYDYLSLFMGSSLEKGLMNHCMKTKWQMVGLYLEYYTLVTGFFSTYIISYYVRKYTIPAVLCFELPLNPLPYYDRYNFFF